MKSEIKTYERNEYGVITSYPPDRNVENKDNYLGIFPEYTHIGINAGDSNRPVVLTLVVDLSKTEPREMPLIPQLNIKKGPSFHGSNFNNNSSLELSKRQLLLIAEAMQDSDRIVITSPDSYNYSEIKKSIEAASIEFPEDCKNLQKVYGKAGYICSLSDCDRVWKKVSDLWCASWLSFSAFTDEDIIKHSKPFLE